MRCVQCGHEGNVEGAAHCSSCGAVMPRAMTGTQAGRPCPRCGVILGSPLPERCPNCRHALGGGEPGEWQQARSEVPLMGRLSERAISLGGGLLGAVLTLLAMSGVSALARPDSFLQRMLDPGGVLNSIPWAITFLFMWSVCMVVMRGLRLRAQHQQLRSPLVGEVRRLVSTGDAPGAVKRLAGRTQASLVLTRARAVLEQWSVSRSLERAESAGQRRADLDADAVAGGYSLVRTFVWAMPILGFIGTVIGISLAVGQFSKFLGGEISNIELVKQQLMGVTHGLSFAFLTTLHGLLGALVVMLPASAVQKAEEDLLTEIDRYCTEEVLTHLQSASGPVVAAGGGFPQEAMAGLVAAMEKCLPNVGAWREQMDSFTEAALRRVSEGCERLASEVQVGARGESERLRELAERIGTKLVEVGDRLSQQYSATQEQISEETAKSAAEFGRLANSFGEAMREHQGQFGRTAEELGALSLQAERMAEVQRDLAASLEKLSSIDAVERALREVSGVLASTREVLSELSGPLEFRLAPSRPSAPGAGGSS